MTIDSLPIALAQYNLLPHATLGAWQAHIKKWVAEGAGKGAKLLVFPEYNSTDLALCADHAIKTSQDMLDALVTMQKTYLDYFTLMAREFGVYIVAGSIPVQDQDGLYNRCYLIAPTGKVGFQDKLMPTRFERTHTTIKAGKNIHIFDTGIGRLGIAICYDIQFPNLTRIFAEQNCDLVLVPSCTGAMTGYNRVQIGCRARALETQMPVASSMTVGDAGWQPLADTNCGAAGLFAPPDHGFPDDGIISLGAVNQPSWVHAVVDFAAHRKVRDGGHVQNRLVWGEQFSASQAPVIIEKI